MSLKSILPILDWLPSYSSENFRGDLIAGLTVGVMLIPQGMAYAMIAGLPPIYGLYASTLPLILYALFGTSRQLAVGPVAMVSLLTATGVGAMAAGGTDLYITLAITLALMVGVIQLGLGLFRLGFLVNFLSHPVISGFTSAAALIIGLSQLKHLLGIDIPRSKYVHEILITAAEHIREVHLPTLAIGLGGIAVILLLKRYLKMIPGPLLAVILGVLAVWGLDLAEQDVLIVGEVPSGLPAFSVPSLDSNYLMDLLPIAVAIALVSFMESIAVAKAIQAKHKDYQVVPNQELVALGAANIGGSFFQSYPVTGGFSRTAVNDQSGAKTGLAAIISAALIVLTLLFLTPLFYYLPKAILASVIMVAVFGLIDIREAVRLWKIDRSDFWMLIITFIGTLTLGIEEGILIGVVLSMAFVIYQTTKPHFAVLGKIPESPHYKNMDRFPQLEARKDLLIVRFDARLYYANTQFFRDTMDRLIEEKGESLECIILDADSINSIDSSALHELEHLVEECEEKSRTLYFTGVKGPVRDSLSRAGFIDRVGEENFFLRIQHAVDYFDERKKQRYKDYALQSNGDSY